jgi:hypothetical protein
VEILVVGAAIGEAMNEPGIAVKREHDGFVLRKQRVKVMIAQAMRVFTRRLQFHQIDHINDAHL